MRSQSEMKTRIWSKAAAGRAAVETINERHRSVRFTCHQSVEKMECIPIYHPDLASYTSVLAEKRRYLTVRSYIYINVN